MDWFFMPKEYGIGVDIERIRRFSSVKARSEKFLGTFMTKRERDYCSSKDSPLPHIASRFAGKEAVIKALGGLLINGISFKDIEILNNKHGCPIVTIKSRGKLNITVKLSLSHSDDTAIAFALATREADDD